MPGEVIAFALDWVGNTLIYHEGMRRAMFTMPMRPVGPLISMLLAWASAGERLALHD